MGFLLGAYGKLAAGRRVRDLQARMMHIQTKARRVTRQISTMSKQIETQKKMELNNLQAMSSFANSQMSGMILGGMTGVSQNVQNLLMGGIGAGAFNQTGLSTEDQQAIASFNSMKTQMSANNEMMLAQMKNQIEEKYENLNDTMLEPLKMEEDELQTEKDSLESQIQIAQADYEACKKMEQADAKNLAPNYTGQG